MWQIKYSSSITKMLSVTQYVHLMMLKRFYIYYSIIIFSILLREQYASRESHTHASTHTFDWLWSLILSRRVWCGHPHCLSLESCRVACSQDTVLMMHFILTNTQLLSSPDVLMDWSAVDYCDVFIRLSFWRHPFTAEHPLLSKWCSAIFLQICSYEATNWSKQIG